jgi:lysophospholipase L1-like esterase
VLGFAYPAVAQEDGNLRGKLVLMGASYAGGWGTPDLGFATVVNRGVAGEDTSAMLVRFDRDVVAEQPSTVLIWGHINGIHRAPEGGMDAVKERIRSDYEAMIARARAGGIDVIIATEITLSEAIGWTNRLRAFVGGLLGKRGYAAMVNEHVRDVNASLAELAREHGVPLLDFEAALDDGAGFREVEYTSADGTHVSEAGYDALTSYARAQLLR